MWRCTLVFQFPPARTWCLSPHSPLSLSISLTFTAAPPFSPAPSSACWPRCQKRYNVSALNTQPVEGIRIWPQLIFFKQILFILYHVEKIKKRNLFSFWNGIDLSSRGIISTLCCYTEGGKLLLELQAKDDKGDPCVGGVCGRGGGRQGSKSSQTVFSRANSQSNPFGVEPRIGGESLLKKKKSEASLWEALSNKIKTGPENLRPSLISLLRGPRAVESRTSPGPSRAASWEVHFILFLFYFLKLRLNLGFSAFWQRLHWQEPANFRTQMSVLIYWCKTGLLVAPSSRRALSPTPPASVPSFDLRVRPPQHRRRNTLGGEGFGPRAPPPPPPDLYPPGNAATPAPRPGQLTWLARRLPARRLVSGPRGPRAAHGAGAAAAARWCWGLITMRKAVPGKASSTRLSISLRGGMGGTERGPVGVTRKLGVSWMRRRPEEVAFASTWKAVALRARTPAASPGDWKPQILPSLLSSLLPSFQPSLTFILIFLKFFPNCLSYIILSFYLVSPFCKPLFCFLTSLLSRPDSFLPPLCVQIYHFVLKTQCFICN